jgi:hypothetical protein
MARDVAKGLWELMQGPYMEPGQNLSPEAVLSLPALAVPAGAALAPKGAIGMFAGRNAKTADLAALQRAEDMAAGGADNEAIRAATGWFKGPDEKWRFEIPDNAARMTGMSDFPASLVMDHDELFRAYPELRDMPVESGRPPGGGRGAYDDGRKTITLAPDMDDPQARVTMLHELQHAVQSREGFAPGSSPTKAVMGESRPHFMRLYNERLNAITTPGTLEDFAKQAGLDNLDEARPFYDEYVKSVEDMRRKGVPPRIDRMAQETAQDQTYKRTAGEVEARDVQSRADFAPDQRAATAPYSSQGIAPEDMIVLNRGGGVQASAPLRDLSGATGAMKYGQHSPSLDLNYALREGTPLKPDQEEMVKALDASMDEHGYGSLYRGVRSGPYAFAKPGDIISDPAFMSFSVDRDQAGVFAMGDPRAGPAIIHLQRAHKVPGYMGLRDTGESEVVLPRNTPLQVIEIRPGDSRAGGAPIVVVRPVSAAD